jgi:hypothetical protein
VLFIAVKAPHFIRFNSDRDVFMEFEILPVHIFYFILFFFNSFMTVSVLTPSSRVAARTPAPSQPPVGLSFSLPRACSRYNGIPHKMFYVNRPDCCRHTAFSRSKCHRAGHPRFLKTDILTLLLPYLPPLNFSVDYILFCYNMSRTLPFFLYVL